MKPQSLFLTLALAFVLPVAAQPTAAASPPRPITHEDVWLMQRPGALTASPDGRWIVASVASPAYDEDQKTSDLWIMASDGGTSPRRLTAGKGSEGSPVWSPDSTRIAFSAKREGDEATQIYVLDLAGGRRNVSRIGPPLRAPRSSVRTAARSCSWGSPIPVP